jgi:hypothetical protein
MSGVGHKKQLASFSRCDTLHKGQCYSVNIFRHGGSPSPGGSLRLLAGEGSRETSPSVQRKKVVFDAG